MAEDLGSIGSASLSVVADFDPVSAQAAQAKAKLDALFAGIGADASAALKTGFTAGAADAAAALPQVTQGVEHLKDSSSSFLGVGEALEHSLTRLAAGFSIGALIEKTTETLAEFAKGAFEAGSHLEKLSQSTGLTMGFLQELNVIGAATNTSMETLSFSSFQLGQRLIGGDTSVVRAVERLGLSYEELLKSSPDEQLRSLNGALEGLTNEQERNRIGWLLFGRSYREGAAALSGDWGEMTATMVKANDDQIASLARADATWAVFLANLRTVVSVAMADATAGLERLAGALADFWTGSEKGAVAVDAHGKSVSLLSVAAGMLIPVMEHASGALSVAEMATRAVEGATAKLGVTLGALTDDQKAYIDSQVAAGASNELLERLVGASKDAVDAYATSLRTKAAPAVDALRVVQDDLARGSYALTAAEAAAVEKELEHGRSADYIFGLFKDAGVPNVQLMKGAIEAMAAKYDDATKAAKAQRDAQDELKASVTPLTAAQQALLDKYSKTVTSEQTLATLTGVSVVQVKQYTEAKKADVAQSELRLNAQIRQAVALSDLIGTTYDAVMADKALGMTTADIAEQEHLLPVLIDAIVDAEHRRQQAYKESAAAAKRASDDEDRSQADLSQSLRSNWNVLTAAQAATRDMIDKRTKSSYDYQVAQIGAWVASERAKLDEHASNYQLALDAIDAESQEKLTALGDRWASFTDEIGASLQDLGQISQGSFGGIVSDIGKVFSALSGLDAGISGIIRAVQTMNKPGGGGTSMASVGAMIAGMTTAIGAAVTIGSVIAQLVTSGDGAAKLRDQFIASMGGLNTLAEKTRLLGKNVSDNLLQFLMSAKNANDVKSSIGAITLALADQQKIINETIYTFTKLVPYMQTTHTLMENIALGGDVAAESTKDLNTMVTQLGGYFAAHGGLWTQSFMDLAAQIKSAGFEVKAMADAIAAQQDMLAKGAVSYADNVAKAWAASVPADAAEAANADVAGSFQEQFARASRIVVNSFNTMVASGKTLREAVVAVGPAIDTLEASAAQFGFANTDILDGLERWRTLTTKMAPVLDQVDSLNQLLIATANLGGLTEASFADMQHEAVGAFKQLTEAGFTSNEALQATGPLLTSILRLHEKNGLAIDDETQALIDQAKAQGDIAADTVSTQEVLQTGFSDVVDAIDGLGEKLQNIKITVDGAGELNVPQFAQGGIAVKPTLGVFGEAGPEALLPLDTYEALQAGATRETDGVMGVANLYIDGRIAAQAMMRYQGSELYRQGLRP